MRPTPIWLCAVRLLRLLAWLGATGRRLRRLDRVPPEQRREVLRQMGADCLNVLNVHVRNDAPPAAAQGTLLVANHVSWLDIFVLVSLYPCSFIAMKELRGWPLIGRMIANAGTVFIDRSNRKDIDPVNAAIAAALRSGGNVCFFPEARTSSGSSVLPLKAALFESAIQADAPIQTVALRYYDGDTRTERVSFADVNFFVTLWRILRLRQINVRTDSAAPMLPEGDRFAIKDRVQTYLEEKVSED